MSEPTAIWIVITVAADLLKTRGATNSARLCIVVIDEFSKTVRARLEASNVRLAIVHNNSPRRFCVAIPDTPDTRCRHGLRRRQALSKCGRSICYCPVRYGHKNTTASLHQPRTSLEGSSLKLPTDRMTKLVRVKITSRTKVPVTSSRRPI